jgi:D-alanyl-D-alanine carboxypeptidase
MMDEFVTPLKLNDTIFPDHGSDQEVPEPYFAGYIIGATDHEKVSGRNFSDKVASGNLITTPANMASYIRALMEGRILSEDALERMKSMKLKPGGGFYGLGCIYTQGLGYGHGGDVVGYVTMMYYDPADETALVIVSNFLDLRRDLNSVFLQHRFMENLAIKAKFTISE